MIMKGKTGIRYLNIAISKEYMLTKYNIKNINGKKSTNLSRLRNIPMNDKKTIGIFIKAM